MKRSTKLLSVVLAVMMVFSTMTAAITAAAVDVSTVKNFNLDAEQSATLVLDYVDDMLADMAAKSEDHGKFKQNVPIVGDILIDYTSVDKALSTVYSTVNGIMNNTLVKLAKNALGDVKDLKYSMLKGVQRKNGDLNVIYALIDFLNANSGLISKAITGNLTVGSIGDSLVKRFAGSDLNGFISKAFSGFSDGEASDITQLVKYFLYKALLADKFGNASSWAAAGKPTADSILNTFINAYVTSDKAGAFGGKVLLPSLSIDIAGGSVYDLIAKALNAAYKDLGQAAANANLKAIIAEYVVGGKKTENVSDAEKALVASGTATALTDSAFAKAADKVYIFRSGDKYYKIDDTAANSLYDIFNFDYAFPADFALTGADGTLTANLNDLIGNIFNIVFADSFKSNYTWTTGGNENLVANVAGLAKAVLPLVPDEFFGNLDAETVAGIKNPAPDADPKTLVNYFTNLLVKALLGNQGIDYKDAETFLEYGVVIANHFAKKVSSDIDYSAKIFNGDKLADKTDDQWVDLLFDMGTEIGMYYLDLKTDIGVDRDKMAEYKTLAGSNDGDLANFLIDDMVDWALQYADGVVAGTDAITARERGKLDGNGGWYKLNVVINNVLPLQFLNDTGSGTFAVDLEVALKQKLIKNLLNLDFADGVGVIARNNKADNVLNMSPVKAILTVVRQVVNAILPNTIPANNLDTVEAFIGKNNLANIVKNLLSALNSRKTKLVPTLLPLVLSFLDDFVANQELVLKAEFDPDAGVIDLRTILSQANAANNYGIADGQQSGTPAGMKVKSMGVLIATDKTMKANGLTTLTLADADKAGVYKLETGKLVNANATDDNKGSYDFTARITGVNGLAADKEIYIISYAVIGTNNVLYAANGYTINLDVAGV